MYDLHGAVRVNNWPDPQIMAWVEQIASSRCCKASSLWQWCVPLRPAGKASSRLDFAQWHARFSRFWGASTVSGIPKMGDPASTISCVAAQLSSLQVSNTVGCLFQRTHPGFGGGLGLGLCRTSEKRSISAPFFCRRVRFLCEVGAPSSAWPCG